ncbi:hypothetical protein LCDVSa097L [Lymphocystis disease virus 3]|uniref:Uncharacterized protein n=1 Tax=Lymphocystis disease virus 3 TaxID=2560566 RepID=A0A1B2RW19_9VIRU|nr:hypothetical protein BZK12_gp097 [Lymphocystis disease virus Sa]AOC55181.1 hypothetical protein LCDVSa097L [Lymphocystis disease virus 3]
MKAVVTLKDVYNLNVKYLLTLARFQTTYNQIYRA